MPDRMVLLPAGRINFMEVKAPGQKQKKIMYSQLRALGVGVFILEEIQDCHKMLKTTILCV